MNPNNKFSLEQIALLQGFFRKNHAQCFWSWNPQTTVTDTNAGRVLKEARTHGGQEGYQLAALFQKPIAPDSCYRFFPVKPDKETGHRLHQADLATNKILAAAGRMVPRDYVDCLFLHQSYCSLGALIWAASAKDDGLPPELILDFLKRDSRYTKEQLEDEITWAVPFEPERMKEQWMQACEEAAALIDWLPPKDKGCLYLSKTGKPATPTPATIGKLEKHFAHPKGAWPKISTISKGKENPSDPN